MVKARRGGVLADKKICASHAHHRCLSSPANWFDYIGRQRRERESFVTKGEIRWVDTDAEEIISWFFCFFPPLLICRAGQTVDSGTDLMKYRFLLIFTTRLCNLAPNLRFPRSTRRGEFLIGHKTHARPDRIEKYWRWINPLGFRDLVPINERCAVSYRPCYRPLRM